MSKVVCSSSYYHGLIMELPTAVEIMETALAMALARVNAHTCHSRSFYRVLDLRRAPIENGRPM